MVRTRHITTIKILIQMSLLKVFNHITTLTIFVSKLFYPIFIYHIFLCLEYTLNTNFKNKKIYLIYIMGIIKKKKIPAFWRSRYLRSSTPQNHA